MEEGREKFDNQIKYMAAMPVSTDEKKYAGPGELPGNFQTTASINEQSDLL